METELQSFLKFEWLIMEDEDEEEKDMLLEEEKTKSELAVCRDQMDELRATMREIRQKQPKAILAELCKDMEITEYEPKQRTLGTGHFGKIYAINWGSDSQYIVTAAQDGKILVWNSHNMKKYLMINLESSWVMTCRLSSKYRFIASGGLDNTITLHMVTPG